MKIKSLWIILAVFVITIAGCTQETVTKTSQGPENFMLYVSDAPADIGDFDSLKITFSEARVFPADEGWEIINLTDTVELTELIGEKVEEIAMVNIEPGTYTKIELYVESIEGIVGGETAEVMVPSNKLQITKSFTVTNESVTEFVFDINVVKKGQQLSYNLLPNIAKSGLKEEHDEAERKENDELAKEEALEEKEEPVIEPCETHDDCGKDQACKNGMCENLGYEAECYSDKECQEGLVCLSYLCEEL
jgi:hypothetical protein